MMIRELGGFLDNPEESPEPARSLILGANILNKRTTSTRAITFRHLNALYGIEAMPPIAKCWQRCGNATPEAVRFWIREPNHPIRRRNPKPVIVSVPPFQHRD